MRLLGDEYVKSEFRAHKAVENPMHIVGPTLSSREFERNLVSRANWVADRVLDGVADVCPKN